LVLPLSVHWLRATGARNWIGGPVRGRWMRYCANGRTRVASPPSPAFPSLRSRQAGRCQCRAALPPRSNSTA